MITVRKILHSGNTRSTGGRDGVSRSDDGRLDVLLSPPGAPGRGTNPEQLFAASWSASFGAALRHAALSRHVEFPVDASVAAEVDLGHCELGFFLQASLTVSLPGLAPSLAQALVDAAERNCPYAKATRGNIQARIRLA